ncbi:MAG: Ig-like domain-containing protein [Thermoplasmata archaeon]|nr:MAG: Ig-like domain-containing protein [Thermoplasmata archaeon]
MKFKSMMMVAIIIASSFVFLNFPTDESHTVSAANILYAGPNSTYKSIQYAIDNATAGDTIIVENGTYYENITIHIPNIILLGNSSTNCTIMNHYDGTDPDHDYSAVINVTSSGVTISGFNICASGSYSFGIRVNSTYSSNSNINNNRITTTGFMGIGIFLNDTKNIALSANIISTQGSWAHGLYFRNANKTDVLDCNVSTTGLFANGLNQTGNITTITNSVISTKDVDINVSGDGNLTAINCSFNTYNSLNGVLQVKNYLDLQVFYEDGITPIQDADIEVTDDGEQIYASAHYGGSNSGTDIEGKAGPILVSDRWYFYSNTAEINQTNINVTKTVDAKWWELRSSVDMSTSKVLTFTATDIFAPAIPAGLSVVQEVLKSQMNISWTPNSDDTVKYSIYSNRSGAWSLLSNESNQTTFYIDDFEFIHNMKYYYRMSAWDEVPIESTWTDPVPVNFIDDVIPKTPNGLDVTPVINGDALNISWFPNNDDTLMYSVYTNRSGTWELLQNVTADNTYIYDNHDLVNGTRYYYKISAWDEVPQQSQLSPASSGVHIDQQSPSPPTGLKAINATGSSIELKWDPNPESDIEGYEIYINISTVGRVGPFINLTTVNASTTKLKIINLTEETTYYFKIKAFDEVPLFSDFSAEVSNTTRDATPPAVPEVSPLPEFTNDTDLVIHGNTEANATITVLRNDEIAGVVIADKTGEFYITITLVEGENVIAVYAIDTSGNVGPKSTAKTVILDTVLPHAVAGHDHEEPRGSDIVFNASDSYDDDSGLMTYTWWIYYEDNNIPLHEVDEKVTTFRFELSGNYTVILRVTDYAGNWDEDDVKVFITTEEYDRTPPKVIQEKLYPPLDGTNIPVKLTILIPFNEHVNISTLEINLSANLSQIQISNGARSARDNILFDIINGHIGYDERNMTVTFKPKRDLKLNLTYSVNLTIADLNHNPTEFIWSFTTQKEPIIPPDTTPPEVNATSFYAKNNRLPVDGQIIIPFNEALNESSITMIVTDSSGNEVKGDLVYDPEIFTIVFTPDNPLKYDEIYSITIYAEDTAGNPIPEEERELTFTTEKEEDDEILSPFVMTLMSAVILIVIVLIVIVLVLQRKRGELVEEEEGVEEEVEEE